jgi:hypothetical protein
MLSHRPWLDKRIVSREQQNTGKSVAVAETRNAHQFVDVSGGIRIARYGGEYAKLRLGHSTDPGPPLPNSKTSGQSSERMICI